MNTIQGITNTLEQGLHIRHDSTKYGILVMGTLDKDDVRIRVNEEVTTISGRELIIDMKHVTIPILESGYSLFPSYLSVTQKGRLILRNDGYWIVGVACMVLLKLLW